MTVIGGFIIHLMVFKSPIIKCIISYMIFFLFTWGSNAVYIISYLRMHNETISIKLGLVMYPLMMSFLSIGLLFSVKMIELF